MSEVIIGSPTINQVVVSEEDNNVIVQSQQNAITTIIAQGPQGPPGVGGISVNDTAKVDKSVIYYDASANVYKVDAIWTVFSLSDGGNF